MPDLSEKQEFRDALVKGAASVCNTLQCFVPKRLPVSVRCQTPYATAVFRLGWSVSRAMSPWSAFESARQRLLLLQFLRHCSAALEAWAKCEENIAVLRASRPSIPDELSDRQADICEPLLAIADPAGEEWPERSRKALVHLCAAEAEDDSLGVKLLSAIRNAFVDAKVDRLATRELLERLINQETDAPWAGWWENDLRNSNTRGPAARLAHFLKPYRTKARVIRLPDNTTPRGYLRADFEDAWKRYRPPETA